MISSSHTIANAVHIVHTLTTHTNASPISNRNVRIINDNKIGVGMRMEIGMGSRYDIDLFLFSCFSTERATGREMSLD